MVIVHRLSAGAARYYLAAVGPEGGDAPLVGEAPGRWVGEGSRGRGTVEAADLRRALPDEPGRVPGFDVTFAAPKSVSVLHALGGARVAAAAGRAHDEAVAAGLAYLERYACAVRVRGRLVAADGFTAAAFRHRTSRADDPHLHTHVIVANRAAGPDRRPLALHTPLLYAERRGAAATYHVVLRGALTSSLGLHWGTPARGRADAVEVPGTVRAGFSRRREAVLGLSDAPVDRRWAERVTRPERDGLVDYESLVFGWHRRAALLDWAAPVLLTGRTPDVPGAGEALLPASDRWSRADLLVAIADHWPDGAPAMELRACTARLLHSCEVVALARGRFTTRTAAARTEAVTAALRACRGVDGSAEALDALHRGLAHQGQRVLVVVSDGAAAGYAMARTGLPAVATADAASAVGAMRPGDVVVISDKRPASADMQRALDLAAARRVEVVRAERSSTGPASAPSPSAVASPLRTIAVPGGDLTAAGTARDAAGTALGDWLARRRTGADAVIVAERDEVDALNARARAALRGAGMLGPVEVCGVAVGDKVRFAWARPTMGIARHAHGDVVAADPGRSVDVRLGGDGRVVRLRAADLQRVAHAHVVPPLPVLVAGRGDVFVVGGRTFGTRHLGGAQLHRYVTAGPASPSLDNWGARAWDADRRVHAQRCEPGPADRQLSLARRAAGRDTGLSR